MKIGFTGTQIGMLKRQQSALAKLFYRINGIKEFHHGDCVGADYEAHEIVRNMDPSVYIVIHPPTDSRKRAFCRGDDSRQELPYLDRNRMIVDETEMLIAAPRSMTEERRSGTWATVRYARRMNKPVLILDR